MKLKTLYGWVYFINSNEMNLDFYIITFHSSTFQTNNQQVINESKNSAFNQFNQFSAEI